jgi:hypothetical protein
MEWWIIFGVIVYLTVSRKPNRIIIERENETTNHYHLTIVVADNSNGAISEQDLLRSKWERGRTINHEQ